MAYSSPPGDISSACRNMSIQDDYSEDPEGSELKYNTWDLRNYRRQHLQEGSMWRDRDFLPSHAVTDCASQTLEWKRPQEFLPNPQLFVGDTERYDVQQRNFGTCWFLSMLANLADKPPLLKKVINAESYKPETDGICHCRLWNFGEWEDIYIDDYLPVYCVNKAFTFYGAMSGTDSNELWVSLLEKAVAKMHGSYCVVDEGGLPSEAYLALTGGVAETVLLKCYGSNQRVLFQRLEKALMTGAMVTCAILEVDGGDLGLFGSHAYSLNKTAKVTSFGGEQDFLIRIRNPHGKNEWEGKWSKSSDWKYLFRGGELFKERGDGEFWMSLEDFMANFTQTTICALTPDFDKDGQSDRLNYVLRIFGKWWQRVYITIPEICLEPMYSHKYKDLTLEGSIPIVVQVIQKELRHNHNYEIGCDILNSDSGKRSPDIEGKPKFARELQRIFRYNLIPGTYTLCPSSRGQEGTGSEYLVRVFSPCPVQKYITED